jgi:hypothetical protein
VLVLAVFAASCGGGSPTKPSSTIPTVAGSYSGTATFTFPEVPSTVNCPASTTITQSGATVNIAPIVLAGDCGNVSIPLGQATIDQTGAINGGSATGTNTDPSCGTYNYTASGGFFGKEFRLSMSATSSTCLNFNFTMTLTRS